MFLGDSTRRVERRSRTGGAFESSHDPPSREHDSNSPPTQWNIFDLVAVIDLAVRCPFFWGTMKELLRVFNVIWQSGTYRSSDLPKTARALSVKLRQLAPQLRSIGIEVEFQRETTPIRHHRHDGRKRGVRDTSQKPACRCETQSPYRNQKPQCPLFGSIPKLGATDTTGRARDANVESVTRAASSFAFRVINANHLLAAIWGDQ
jgi:hypothetical protein